jgi:adenosylhomocysteinase
MDMSFAGQALSAEYLLRVGSKLESKVIRVPEQLDLQIARWRLEEFGKRIDSLTKVQEKYARSWRA